jgi:hypothetical protein
MLALPESAGGHSPTPTAPGHAGHREVGLVLLQPNAVVAADGAIPIWEPMTIANPGAYVVTRNITSSDTVVSD